MTHNRVFVDNQEILPLYLNMGTGPGRRLVVVSVGFIPKSYRGLSSLNQNVSRSGDTGHTKCGINFPLVATVGSPVMAVCDAVPGKTKSVEGIVLY